jgi:GTP cyclohydrolase I
LWAAGLRDFFRRRDLDPESNALRDTPDRVQRALWEMTSGYDEDPAALLTRQFVDVERADEMIALVGIGFVSLCEHHMMPFTGTASVAYVPADGAAIVGLSKLARLVDVYARRLQVQERLTRQVTDALDEHLDTIGSACVVRASHTCMTARGVRKGGADMVTSSVTGVFRDNPAARAEFMALIG